MENNWNNVFEAYPEVDEIYVVDDMPFLEEGHADGHSNTTKKPVQKFKRPANSEDKEAVAAEKKAAKDAVDAEKKAKK